MAKGVTEYYGKLRTFNYRVSANVTAGQIVSLTGNRTVAPAGAGVRKGLVKGVALYDMSTARQSELDEGTIGGSTGRHLAVGRGYAAVPATVVTAGTAVVAGDRLKSAANGRVAKLVEGTDAENLAIGEAEEGAAADATFRAIIY